jgi:RimJ/RimL family protein N-acetyltransferase
MKLKPIDETDYQIIQKWLSENESLSYYLITESIRSDLPSMCFGIYLNNGELIGWTTLANIDYTNKKAEYGIAIPNQKHYRLGGFVTRTILKMAFQELELHRVYVRPLSSNVKPYPDDIRDGFFTREGIERQSVKRGDIYEDVIVMSVLKNEFERKWL